MEGRWVHYKVRLESGGKRNGGRREDLWMWMLKGIGKTLALSRTEFKEMVL